MKRSRPQAPRLLHRLVVAGLAGLLMAGLYVAARDAAFVRAIESQALALRFEFRGPIVPGAGIVVVAIDDDMVAESGGWPLPRHLVATLIERLAEAGADVVALDLLLLDMAPPSDGNVPGPGDQQLIGTARAFPRLVLPMALLFDADRSASGMPVETLEAQAFALTEWPAGGPAVRGPVPQAALAPFGALRDAAALGHVNLTLDSEGVMRAMYHAIGVGDLYFPSLPVLVLAMRENVPRSELVAVLGEGIRLGDRMIETGPDMDLPVNFLGPAGTVEFHSALDVIEGTAPADAFRDRIVFVGADALGIGDIYATPFGPLSGVEALATVTDNLLYDRSLVRDERTAALDLAAIFIIALSMAALPRLGRGAFLVAVVPVLLWEGATYIAFVRAGWWLDATFPALAGLASAAAVLALWFREEKRHRERAERDRAAIAPYVSPVVAAGLVDGVSDRPRPAVVMFVDLAGYTSLAERLEPTEASALLQRFRAHLSAVAARHGGIIEKFVGDGAMILFGVPEPDLQDPADALACARDLAENAPAAGEDGTVATGWDLHIGVHYGPVTLARIGDQTRAEITATGDTVNVASRLEAATRDYGATIVASGAVIESVRAGGELDLLAGFRREPDVLLRGRQEPIDLWLWAAPMGHDPAAASPRGRNNV